MAKATTNDPISDDTRRLLAEAKRLARKARTAVALFATAGAAAMKSFDADTTPLRLDDAAFERVERRCGLHAVLQEATDIEARLVRLFEDRR